MPTWVFQPTWILGIFLCIGLTIRRKFHENCVHTRLFCRQSHIGPHSIFLWENNDQKFCFLCRMVLEWREREHGDVEKVVQDDLMARQALQACGLYKFWCLGSLRAKPRLLQLLVDYWDPESGTFQIDGMSLNIEVEDIYFITGLS